MTDTLARMRQLIGNAAGWVTNDIVLGDGEIGFERVGNDVKFKVGNGTDTFSELSYVTLLDTFKTRIVDDLNLELPDVQNTVQYGMTNNNTLNVPPTSLALYGNLVLTWLSNATNGGQVVHVRDGETWFRDYQSGFWEEWKIVAPSITISNNAPDIPRENHLWLDTSGKPPELKYWNDTEWVRAQNPPDYVRSPTAPDLNDEFPDTDRTTQFANINSSTLNAPAATGADWANLVMTWRGSVSYGGQIAFYRHGEVWTREYNNSSWGQWEKAAPAVAVSDTEPSIPYSKQLWLDTSGPIPALKHWNGTNWELAQASPEIVSAPHINDLNDEFPEVDDTIKWGTILGATSNLPTTSMSANSVAMTWRNATNAGGQMAIDRDGAIWTRVYAAGSWEDWKQVASSQTISSSAPSGGNNGDVWFQVS